MLAHHLWFAPPWETSNNIYLTHRKLLIKKKFQGVVYDLSEPKRAAK